MSRETTKIESKNPPSIQLDVFHREKILKDIDNRYPNAKINPNIVEGDQIHGYTVHGKPLEEYAKDMDDTYKDESKTDIYHQH